MKKSLKILDLAVFVQPFPCNNLGASPKIRIKTEGTLHSPRKISWTRCRLLPHRRKQVTHMASLCGCRTYEGLETRLLCHKNS